MNGHLNWRHCTTWNHRTWGYIPLHRPCIEIIYCMYLQFGLLKPLKNRGTCRGGPGSGGFGRTVAWTGHGGGRIPGGTLVDLVALVKINGSISGNLNCMKPWLISTKIRFPAHFPFIQFDIDWFYYKRREVMGLWEIRVQSMRLDVQIKIWHD